ncbi:MAG: hypothetical protein V4719_22065 [Planctomycetota bacterium]
MQQTPEGLRQQAETQLEINNFAAARELFIDAAKRFAPSQGLLANLSVAEDELRLQVRREIRACHPDSFESCISELQSLISVGRAERAMILASELVSSSTSESQLIVAHLMRFRASVRTRILETAIEDFTYLWAAGEIHEGARRFRYGLLKSLAAVDESTACNIMQQLSLIPDLPESVSLFLRAKTEELRCLQSARDVFIKSVEQPRTTDSHEIGVDDSRNE